MEQDEDCSARGGCFYHSRFTQSAVYYAGYLRAAYKCPQVRYASSSIEGFRTFLDPRRPVRKEMER